MKNTMNQIHKKNKLTYILIALFSLIMLSIFSFIFYDANKEKSVSAENNFVGETQTVIGRIEKISSDELELKVQKDDQLLTPDSSINTEYLVMKLIDITTYQKDIVTTDPSVYVDKNYFKVGYMVMIEYAATTSPKNSNVVLNMIKI